MLCDTEDTIAAIASAPGGACRGIVRVSGPQCATIVARIFTPIAGRPALETARLASRLPGSIDLGQPLGVVPADLLLWPGTRSYTRQPSAEIHTFGSPPLLEALLARLCERGARLARPGEFTLRAFLAGRIDLTQAEAVLGVIDARDQRELSVSLAQLAGGLAGPLHGLRDELLDLLARLEAGLDFVEEDIEFIAADEIDRSLAAAARRIDELAARMQTRGIAGRLPRVVLCGPPNAGKSSLLNALSGRSAAIVSAEPGTTRDYVSATVRCGNLDVELIDTAGTDAHALPASIAAAAQSLGAAQIEGADLLLVCAEATDMTNPSSLIRLPDEPHAIGPAQLRVWTKIDRCRQPPPDTPGAVATSSVTGAGIDELKSAIAAALTSAAADASVVAGTAARCRESLLHASECLARARPAAAEQGEEFAAAEIRAALDDLGRVAGAVYTDDVLDRIFSRFCIGK